MKTIGGFVGAALIWGGGSGRATAAEAAAGSHMDPNTIGTTYPRYPTIDHLPAAFRGYPAPTYVPAGYGLLEMDTNRPDGLGGPDELSLWYADRKLTMGLNNPLIVWIAPKPIRASLVGSRQGQPILLTLPSSRIAQAEYHDGWWILQDPRRDTLSWDTSNVHSVTFHLRGYTIAIRGARLANIGYDELVRVASSIESPVV